MKLLARIALLLTAGWLTACAPRSSDEELLRRLIEQGEQAAEARSSSKLMALIDDDYQDSNGFNKIKLESFLRGYFFLHTKGGLMDELGKIRRVVEKQAPISEVLLVLDATTGQNGLAQAEAFIEHGGVTGLVLTKLDGSAKGGFVLAVQEKTGLPIKLIGQGERIGDLTGFTPHVFAQKLVG